MANMVIDESIEVSEDMMDVGNQVIDNFDGMIDWFACRSIFQAMMHQMLLDRPELREAFGLNENNGQKPR